MKAKSMLGVGPQMLEHLHELGLHSWFANKGSIASRIDYSAKSLNGQQKDETSVKKNMKKKSKGVNVDGELIAKDKPLEVAVDRNEATEPATEKNKKHKLEEQQ
ncbi:hypothetical protein MUK42_37348 [Musa troglodytarum]|uniref:Uncharacterized protein n=1 Tax=Musa troglodytarum TaxID=320322 RepID=A0A9E7HD87_9LILI|nr:hypothetical protein MUK42_37348 [Musa troglodytarum]